MHRRRASPRPMTSLNRPLLDDGELDDAQLLDEVEDTLQDAHVPLLPPPQLPGALHWLHRAWRAALDALSTAWHWLKQSFQRMLWWRGSRQPRLSLLQEERLRTLQERVAVPYDAEDPEHQAVLRRLWVVAFPGEAFPARGIRSSKWREMGWQQDDPGSDVRGGGLLSLQLLAYFAETSEAVFLSLMRKEQGTRAEWEYPFAAAGVNLTFMLVNVLQLSGSSSELHATSTGRGFLRLLVERDDALEQLYMATFRALDEEWLHRKAGYMEFNVVLRHVQGKVQHVLASRQLRCIADLPPLLLRGG